MWVKELIDYVISCMWELQVIQVGLDLYYIAMWLEKKKKKKKK